MKKAACTVTWQYKPIILIIKIPILINIGIIASWENELQILQINYSNMEIERALIVKKVWLDRIFDEGKVWEMRTSKTKITGRVGLIESGTGLIVGEVDLVGCSNRIVPKDEIFIKKHKIENLELLDKWKYAWFLDNAKRYKDPIPYKHPKGAVIWVKL